MEKRPLLEGSSSCFVENNVGLSLKENIYPPHFLYLKHASSSPSISLITLYSQRPLQPGPHNDKMAMDLTHWLAQITSESEEDVLRGVQGGLEAIEREKGGAMLMAYCEASPECIELLAIWDALPAVRVRVIYIPMTPNRGVRHCWRLALYGCVLQ
jgi:hypothetical protein